MYSYYGREAEQNRDQQWKTDINISQSDQSSTKILDAKNSLENQLDFVSLDHDMRHDFLFLDLVSKQEMEIKNKTK